MTNTHQALSIADIEASKQSLLDEGFSTRSPAVQVHDRLPTVTLKYAAVHMALRRLVLLKEHKDKHGKDAYYEAEQPYAWKQARTTITEIEDE